MIVVDASIALSWVLPGEDEVLSERVLRLVRDDGGLVPAIWTLEVGNGLTMAERTARMTGSQVEKALSLLRRLPIRVAVVSLEADFGHVVNLARKHRLTTYDASYLEIALRSGSRLATLDRLLTSTARKIGVETIG